MLLATAGEESHGGTRSPASDAVKSGSGNSSGTRSFTGKTDVDHNDDPAGEYRLDEGSSEGDNAVQFLSDSYSEHSSGSLGWTDDLLDGESVVPMAGEGQQVIEGQPPGEWQALLFERQPVPPPEAMGVIHEFLRQIDSTQFGASRCQSNLTCCVAASRDYLLMDWTTIHC